MDMGTELQLYLRGLEGKTVIVRIDEDSSVSTLRKTIYDVTRVSLDDMKIFYCSKELRDTDDNGKVQFLSDYHIKDEGNLVLVLKLRDEKVNVIESSLYMIDSGVMDRHVEMKAGTVDSTEGQEGLLPQLKILGPDVELTSEPDMVTFDDDKDGQRAKMPCGHAIGPETLTAYCRSILSNGKYEFHCPKTDPSNCNRLWDFHIVRKFAVLTKSEVKEFEMKIAVNFLAEIGIKQCPKCLTYVERITKNEARVTCPVCTERQKQKFEFCWFCLGSWTQNGTDGCGTTDCSGEDPRRKILRNCSEKNIGNVRNPSIRACPKCQRLIEHVDGCKHMSCICGQGFCFVCLQVTNSSGSLQCGSCSKAPVQTALT